MPLAAGAETSAEAPRTAPDRAQGTNSLDERLAALIAEVRPEAIAAGISPSVFDAAFQGLTADASLLDLLTAQPEHVMAPWDYMGRIISDKRIAEGRQKLAEHKAVLDEIEAKLGVDRHVVVAIWGIESSYGALPGKRPIVRSLATLAVADPRRPAFWRKELLAALQIIQRGDVAADRMWGSWAGAMGHTQFMPSSFLAHAIDFDGDGHRDIWQSVADALGSTATYLKRSGWQTGEAWGLEVVLPAGFEYRLAAPRDARDPAEWRALGLEPPAGSDWPAALSRPSLVLPAGMHGPAFLVGGNFQAILKYNNATLYALAVGHLADRLAGRPALAALWPTNDPPLDRAGRKELQERLAREGHAVGSIDGIIGDGTRNAVRAWQGQQGMPADGWPGTQLLERLRGARSASN
jgi:membrane-bound lytic murein transglycosylase B